MKSVYSASVFLYLFAVQVAVLFNLKAKRWIAGRKNLLQKIEKWRTVNPGKLVWIHCASLGEFEQGRPVIEAIRKNHSQVKILLTFFSPSGYEVRKNYNGADFICYLPADTPRNARRFLEILQPAAVLFVKYEYWANYFFACKQRQIPLFIVSGILRPGQRFFGLFSSFWKKVLNCVTHFFVQNEQTQFLLEQLTFSNVTLAGDTRFDRVLEISQTANEIEELKKFRGNSICIVGGSTWDAEEKMLMAFLHKAGEWAHPTVKIIVVPHEIDEAKIAALHSGWPGSIRWSQCTGSNLSTCSVMIVDTIGLLSSIYRYADVAVVGGGFGKGIHNILEAAVWGVPVVFGPKYRKFDEARQLIDKGGAFSVMNSDEFNPLLEKLVKDKKLRFEAGEIARSFVQDSQGATVKILQRLGHL